MLTLEDERAGVTVWRRLRSGLDPTNSVSVSCSVVPTVCDPLDCSPRGSSVHGIFHERILEWVAISSSRGSSRPRDRTQVSCTAGRFFTGWATVLQALCLREQMFYIYIYRERERLSMHTHNCVYLWFLAELGLWGCAGPSLAVAGGGRSACARGLLAPATSLAVKHEACGLQSRHKGSIAVASGL